MDDVSTRRRFLTAGGTAAFAGLVGCLGGGSGSPTADEDTATDAGTTASSTASAAGSPSPTGFAGSESWPTFQADRRNTGTAANTPPADDVERLWRVEVGSRGYPSPAVVEGRVYVGFDDGTIRALGASDGRKQWSFRSDDPIKDGVTVSGGPSTGRARTTTSTR